MPSRYNTGIDQVDAQLKELAELVNRPEDAALLEEMLVSVVRMGNEGMLDRGELKMVNTALKEMRYAFGLFEPYKHIPKATIFGSARTKPEEPAYACARDFGAAMVANDWMVMTGAGPGIMQAGLEGAGRENSFGINILLPFESEAPEIIADDPKLINFRYFFTRKLTFMKETNGYALLPGGFGTMDEGFELLTLMQTGKAELAPVVMLDPPGSTYWQTWLHFVERELLGAGLISEGDLCLVKVTNDIDEATEELTSFYSVYHSMRYVGQRLIIRLKSELPPETLAALNVEFADIIEQGSIEVAETTESEIADDDVVDLPRISLHFNRAGFSRLRVLVDRINGR